MGIIENQKPVSLLYDIEETGVQTSTKSPTLYSRTAARKRLIGQARETRSTYILHKPLKQLF
jgi:hypothetical protein